MTNLTTLFLQQNQLTNLTLASDLNRLLQLDLRSNLLTTLTLPPGMTNLTSLLLDGNPLTTLILPEPLAQEILAGTVATLQTQGISVVQYPLNVRLTKVLRLVDAFRFAITGPPGVYNVFSSTNLTAWSPLATVTNPLGSVFFSAEVTVGPKKFYRAILQAPPVTPPNMVIIPSNSLPLGSPATEFGHRTDQRLQTTAGE
jgi:hypothetical protein